MTRAKAADPADADPQGRKATVLGLALGAGSQREHETCPACAPHPRHAGRCFVVVTAGSRNGRAFIQCTCKARADRVPDDATIAAAQAARGLVPLHTLSVGARFRVIADGPVWTLDGWRDAERADTHCEQPAAATGRSFRQPVYEVRAS